MEDNFSNKVFDVYFYKKKYYLKNKYICLIIFMFENIWNRYWLPKVITIFYILLIQNMSWINFFISQHETGRRGIYCLWATHDRNNILVKQLRWDLY